MSSVGARFQVRVRSPRVDPDIRQGAGSAAWTASAGDEASSAMGLNCPSLMDWECGKRAARARRYAFWTPMNGANLRAVVMTWHRSGNKNNLAIGSDGSEWTTRGIGLSVTIDVPVVKRAAAQQSVYSAAVTRYDQRPNRNTQRGDADSVPLRTLVCRVIRSSSRATVGASAGPRTAPPPTRSNARAAGSRASE